jgi:DNA-binding MarR family transcriptional regulator
MLNLAQLLADTGKHAKAAGAPAPGDLLLGPGHRRPLQAAILTYLAGRAGAPAYDIAEAVGTLRQTVDNCLTECLIPHGLVSRTKRRQCIGGRIFRAWFYRLTPAARQRLTAGEQTQEAAL